MVRIRASYRAVMVAAAQGTFGENAAALATPGTNGLGGGGGGGGSRGAGLFGASGGSGIVLIRYLLGQGDFGVGGDESTIIDGGQTYRLHTFDDIGAFTFTVIPEPGTFATLLVGGLSTMFVKRRRR